MVADPITLERDLLDARARADRVTADLDGERLLGPMLAIVNPPLWEIGHVSWFQERWCLRLRTDGSLGDSILPGADALYDSSAVAHDTRWDLRLPTRAETLAYMTRVLEAAIRRALATRLPSAMIPTRFRVVARLPMTPNGKLDRHALLDLARSAAPELAAERTLTYPRDPIETRLAALWCEILGRALVGIDESFLDLGGDSRTGLALFSAIEQRFGRALPLALLFEAPTVREQAVHLRAGIAREGLAPAIDWSATLVPESATTNRPRLFCVPAVDGYAFVYRPLAVELAATENPTHVVVLQFPGLDGTSAPLATVAALAHELVARLRTIQPHGPYALLGHSYGGLVAYEMARRLVESGEAIELLALCDSHTPDAVSFVARAVRGSEKLLLAARHIWRETAPTSKVTPFQGIVHLFAAASTFGHTVARAFRRRGGRTLVAHTVHEVRRASMAARGTYRFGPPLDLPATRVVLFRAAPGPESARRWLRFAEPSNGWARRFVRAIEVRDAEGDHIQMLNPPNVAGIAREISTARGPL